MYPTLVSQVFRGNTIFRSLFHQKVYEHREAVSGTVVDIAGSRAAEYYQYLSPDLRVQTLNIKGEGVDVKADFNQPLPLAGASVDTALLFNALYIADDPPALFAECKRILKPGGRMLISSPYISNEMRDPHDYQRFTSEGLERLVRGSGMRIESIEPFGERFSAAAYLLHPFFLVAPIRLIAYALALGLDRIIPPQVKKAHPTPLGYFVVARV